MRIVLCDDHRLFMDSLATVLARQGDDVVTGTTPDEAIRSVRESDPDVCVLDVNFPQGSGLDAARVVIERFPRTRVLMLSASEEPETVSAALAMGVTGWVRKDQALTAVLDAIERVAQGHRTVEPALRRYSRAGGPAAQPETARLLQSLTPREREVLQHLVDAHDTTAIAARLHISRSTARSHVQKVLTKFGVSSRLQAVTLVTRGRLDEEGS